MRDSKPQADRTIQDSPTSPRLCPVTGRLLEPRRRALGFLGWLSCGMGLASLLWFLVRVIPKPSRAAYPCQRIAFPMASGFVVWVLALLGSAFAWRKARSRQPCYWKAFLWGAAAIAGCALVVASLPTARSWAGPPPNAPVGTAKGIFPGRVAWVYAPEAVNWAGYTSPEHWFETNHTDISVVEQMMSKALQSVGGGGSDAAAWDAIFKYFNQSHGKGARGYQAGEKVAIKINLTTCNARSGTNTVDIYGTYEKQNAYWDGSWLNTIDNSPQMLLTLAPSTCLYRGSCPDQHLSGRPDRQLPGLPVEQAAPRIPERSLFRQFWRVRTHANRVFIRAILLERDQRGRRPTGGSRLCAGAFGPGRLPH